MKIAAGNLTFGGGSVDHDAAADADAGMVYGAAGITLEEHQISGLQFAHGGDELPSSIF